ncbi:MAG: hypothetical protein JXA61_00575 [Bacteroidales bacterium]|nr:hypothetical protein [Bacteroidales bacterium]
MKKIRFFGLILTLIMVVVSCEEESIDPAGERGAGVVPVLSNVDPAFFLAADIENSFVSFDVSLAAGDVADGGIVEISMNGQAERAQVQTIATFPATITLTGAEVANALGIQPSTIEGGDVFNIEILTTKDGATTRSNVAVNAPVACEYNPLLASGSYTAYSAPSAWNATGLVTLTVDDVDNTTVYVSGLAAMEGNNEDQGPLVMHIDLNTFTVTADKTVIASDYFGYTNGAFEGYGTYESCAGTFTMYFTITVEEGSFGTHLFTLTKN